MTKPRKLRLSRCLPPPPAPPISLYIYDTNGQTENIKVAEWLEAVSDRYFPLLVSVIRHDIEPRQW